MVQSQSVLNESMNHSFVNSTNQVVISERDLLIDIITSVFRYLIPIFIVVGVTGNSMVWILINSNRVLKSIPSNVYLLALGLFSGTFLVSLALTWLDQTAQYFYYTKTAVGCKIVTYVTHTCDFVSIWLIVLVCCDRFMLLTWSNTPTTKARARRHVYNLVAVAFITNSWLLFLASADGKRCKYIQTHPNLYAFFTYTEAISCLIIPALIITTLNVYIVGKLHWYIRKNGTHLSNNQSVTFAAVTRTESSESTKRRLDAHLAQKQKGNIYHSVPNYEPGTVNNNHLQTPQHKATKPSLQSILLSHTVQAGSSSNNAVALNAILNGQGSAHGGRPSQQLQLQRPKIRRQELQLTRTLLIVTSAFVTLNLPGYAIRVLNTFFTPQMVFPSKRSYMITLLIAYGLQYFHHAILFYLYIFYSPQMKKRLGPTAMKLLECYCMKPVPDDIE